MEDVELMFFDRTSNPGGLIMHSSPYVRGIFGVPQTTYLLSGWLQIKYPAKDIIGNIGGEIS